MPSYSERQRRFMGAELARKRAGKRTRTGMREKQLEEFAGGVVSKSKRQTRDDNRPRGAGMGLSDDNMPRGASMSPSGDIGAMRQKEAVKLGGFSDGKTVEASKELPC